MHVRIFCSTAISPPLASFAALLTYGHHEKFISDCGHLPCLEETLTMAGVIAALESLKRPSDVIVLTHCDDLQSIFKRTAFDFPEKAKALEKIHRIQYAYVDRKCSVELERCCSEAEEAIDRYRRACVITAPAKALLESAFECLGIPQEERIAVSEPEESDGGEEELWGQPVLIRLDDICPEVQEEKR